jgi:hypothetical protein
MFMFSIPLLMTVVFCKTLHASENERQNGQQLMPQNAIQDVVIAILKQQHNNAMLPYAVIIQYLRLSPEKRLRLVDSLKTIDYCSDICQSSNISPKQLLEINEDKKQLISQLKQADAFYKVLSSLHNIQTSQSKPTAIHLGVQPTADAGRCCSCTLL